MGEAAVGDGRTCPTCGDANECGMEKGEATCWCFTLPHVPSLSETEQASQCFCRTCLSRVIADRRLAKRDGSGTVMQ